MIWVIIYLIVGIILAVFYSKRLQLQDPEIDTDELIAFGIVCTFLWPYVVLMNIIF